MIVCFSAAAYNYAMDAWMYVLAALTAIACGMVFCASL